MIMCYGTLASEGGVALCLNMNVVVCRSNWCITATRPYLMHAGTSKPTCVSAREYGWQASAAIYLWSLQFALLCSIKTYPTSDAQPRQRVMRDFDPGGVCVTACLLSRSGLVTRHPPSTACIPSRTGVGLPTALTVQPLGMTEFYEPGLPGMRCKNKLGSAV